MTTNGRRGAVGEESVMKAVPLVCALAAFGLLAACAGGPPPEPCVTDWRTTCSGPDTNGGDQGPEAAPADASPGDEAA